MEKVNWMRVAVFYEKARPFFSTTYDYLLQRIDEMGNSSLELHSAVLDTHLPLEMIRDEEIRIVYVLTGPNLASKILCLADHMGLVSPNIQWLFFGRDVQDFQAVSFIYNSINYTCSDERMIEALERNILMNFKLVPFEQHFERRTISGITYNDFKELYKQKLEKSEINFSVWGPLAYDALWSLALCLNSTADTVSLSDYGIGEYNTTALIRECFDSLNFTGVTGDITFDPQSGFVDRAVDIYQVVDGIPVHGAVYRNMKLTDLNELKVITDKYERIPLQFWPMSGAFLVITLILLVLIATSHVLTVVYGKHPSIKAASPKITHFTFVGCYVLGLGAMYNMLSYAMGSSLNLVADGWLCQITFSIFFPIGFTLIFGSVLVRTWRLYRIFVHVFHPGRTISDKVLIIALCCMVGVDTVIAVLWTSLDPLQAQSVRIGFTEQEDGQLAEEVYVECNNQWYFLWFGAVFAYRFVEVLAVLTLALLTRSIKKRNFSTNSIQVHSYLISLTFLILVPVYTISALNRANKLLLTVNVLALCLLLTLFLLYTLTILFIPALVLTFRAMRRGKKWAATIQHVSRRLSEVIII